MRQHAEVVTLFQPNRERETRHEASCRLQQAIADVFPLALYPEPTPDTDLADEVGEAITDFYEHGVPASELSVLANPRAQDIIDWCMRLAIENCTTPHIQAHYDQLRREISVHTESTTYPPLHLA